MIINLVRFVLFNLLSSQYIKSQVQWQALNLKIITDSLSISPKKTRVNLIQSVGKYWVNVV